jgi:hypothetical protein
MKGKNWVILIVFVWLLVPFILMTDLYPLFRFGMFAESVQNPHQIEKLTIQYQEKNGIFRDFRSDWIGLSEGHFAYLLRHYYYQDKIQQVFRQIAEKMPKTQNFYALRLVRTHKSFENQVPTIEVLAIWQR